MYRFPEIRVLYYTMIHCLFSGFCPIQVPPVFNVSLFRKRLWRFLYRGEAGIMLLGINARLPEGRAGFTESALLAVIATRLRGAFGLQSLDMLLPFNHAASPLAVWRFLTG